MWKYSEVTLIITKVMMKLFYPSGLPYGGKMVGWLTGSRDMVSSMEFTVVRSSFEDEISDGDVAGSWSVVDVSGWSKVGISGSSGIVILVVEGERSIVELMKKRRRESSEIWNLDREREHFMLPKDNMVKDTKTFRDRIPAFQSRIPRNSKYKIVVQT